MLIKELKDKVESHSSQLESLASGGGDHVHLNKTVLDALSDVSGELYYNSNPIGGESGGTIPTTLAELIDDATHRLVTDTEISTWNAKSNFSGSYTDLTNKPTIPTVPTTVSSFTNDSKYVSSTTVSTMIVLTQAEYDALGTSKNTDNNLYIIRG